MMGSCIFLRAHSLGRTHRLRQTAHHNHRLYSQQTNAWNDRRAVLETLTRESCTYTMRLCNKRVIEMKTSEKKLKWKTATTKHSELTSTRQVGTDTHANVEKWLRILLLCIFYFCCLNKMESERERRAPRTSTVHVLLSKALTFRVLARRSHECSRIQLNISQLCLHF